jgi:hypothetical protein
MRQTGWIVRIILLAAVSAVFFAVQRYPVAKLEVPLSNRIPRQQNAFSRNLSQQPGASPLLSAGNRPSAFRRRRVRNDMARAPASPKPPDRLQMQQPQPEQVEWTQGEKPRQGHARTAE